MREREREAKLVKVSESCGFDLQCERRKRWEVEGRAIRILE
jgi:hypothetical protein